MTFVEIISQLQNIGKARYSSFMELKVSVRPNGWAVVKVSYLDGYDTMEKILAAVTPENGMYSDRDCQIKGLEHLGRVKDVLNELYW